MLGGLSPEQIEAVLREATVARIGCHAGGTTYVVPVTYAYDGGAVVGSLGDGINDAAALHAADVLETVWGGYARRRTMSRIARSCTIASLTAGSPS